jgi:hypothetical protein
MTFTITAWAANGRTVKTITGPVGPHTLEDGDMTEPPEHNRDRWQAWEDQCLIDMVKFGLDHKHIAVHLKRTRAAICQRMHLLRNKPR